MSNIHESIEKIKLSPTQMVGRLLDNVPDELREKVHRWNVHIDKAPYQATNGNLASVIKLAQWGSFREMLRALQSGEYDGASYLFVEGDGYIGIDIDKCRDPETGEV